MDRADPKRIEIMSDVLYLVDEYVVTCSDAQLKALQTYLAKKHHEMANPVPRRTTKAPQEHAPPKPA